MTSLSVLTEIQSSPTLLLVEAEASSLADASLCWVAEGLTVRSLRGRRMRSFDALWGEVTAALQFPYYCGNNWAAINECLSDMEWLLPTRGIVVVIREGGQVLVDEHPDGLRVFVDILAEASRTYGQPLALGEWWDRPAVPFHVVLHGPEPGKWSRRWTAVAADLQKLDL